MNYITEIKKKIFLRDGHLILISNMIDKVLNFIIMMIAARYMSLSIYGHFSYIKSIVTMITLFAGFGGNHALLRFGMDSDDIKEKYNILFSALILGSLFTIILLIIIKLFFSYYDILINDELNNIFNIYIFFILSYYIYDVVRNYYRINMDNRTYAINTIRYSIFTFLLGSFSLIIFNYMIFLLIIVLSPFLITIFDNKKLLFSKKFSIKFEYKFWKYGLLVGGGAFLNQFFMQSDILILGLLNVESELIAQYKVATLLVYTFIFIPNTFLVRDFTTLSAHAKDKDFLLQYVYSYLRYGSIILLFITPLFYISSPYLLVFLFGEKFQSTFAIQNILIFGLIAIVLLRMIFGNILNAIGKANLNVINAFITIVIALPLLYFFTKTYGVEGTAFSMVIVFFFSGIVSLGMFLFYLKGIKGKNE